MKFTPKPIADQVVVITGASSGIGLTTARLAAERGARVVLASRDEEALRGIVSRIHGAGGRAVFVVADVGREEEVRGIADTAVREYGGFDTWVNNAGVSIYGRFDETPLDDQRKLFDTNYWGTVHGTRIAADHLRTRGGVIINIGSVVSDRAIPLQGAYSASKHAVKGFTDAARMELEEAGAPVALTLIKPAAIDTPYTRHARNYMEVEPAFPPPVYAPDVVAKTILRCAVKPVRDILVGGGGKMLSGMGAQTPRLTDLYMEKSMFRQQKSDRPRRADARDGLDGPGGGARERGGYEGHVMESSLYTQAALNPLLVAGAAIGLGLLLAGGWWGAKEAVAAYRDEEPIEEAELAEAADRLHYAGRY